MLACDAREVKDSQVFLLPELWLAAFTIRKSNRMTIRMIILKEQQ